MNRIGKGRLVGLMATVGALFLIGVACGGWGKGSEPSKEPPALGVTEVRLDDFAFAPANIVIDAGTAVTWTNYDSETHTVTSDEGDELKSERLGEDETYRYTFDTPGEYFYTTPRWHLKHCFYYWRKQHRASFTGVTIEGRYKSERHVKHCGDMFLHPPTGLTYSYVTLKSSSPDPPEFELRRLKAAGIDPFEFDTRAEAP